MRLLCALSCLALALALGTRSRASLRRATACPRAAHVRAYNPLDGESDFDRYQTLRNIVDGTAAGEEVDRLVALLLGFGGHSAYVDDARAHAWQTEFVNGPDLFAEVSDSFAWLESDIPDDDDQAAAMRVLLEALYGEEAVAVAQRTGDPDFARRSTIVSWMVLTTTYWSDIVAAPSRF
eukprot:CAMPEP_0179875668 /NCGR_PEP_ID=MMETSP0982-20121206/23691_1 /TAXON_ID=483367 /ORGANISM="non described non described, Strain CCMP 2436" /LENGTH=178 /DNA_ID=CAMNT_0021767839 /DNA_START=1 /DNA_END=537 /DNA_ORIENTATION=+